MFGNLTEVIFRESDQFSQFIQVLYTSQMVNMLREGGTFTIFAPNNYAFSRVPKPLLDKMLQDKETAEGILQYFFVISTLSFLVQNIETLTGIPVSCAPEINCPRSLCPKRVNYCFVVPVCHYCIYCPCNPDRSIIFPISQ